MLNLPQVQQSSTSGFPERKQCWAQGSPNDFLVMAVALQKCQPALPQGPLLPPVSSEKKNQKAKAAGSKTVSHTLPSLLTLQQFCFPFPSIIRLKPKLLLSVKHLLHKALALHQISASQFSSSSLSITSPAFYPSYQVQDKSQNTRTKWKKMLEVPSLEETVQSPVLKGLPGRVSIHFLGQLILLCLVEGFFLTQLLRVFL